MVGGGGGEGVEEEGRGRRSKVREGETAKGCSYT